MRPAFTLLETLIGLALGLVLALGAWTLARNILSFNTTTYDSLSAQADLLKVMNVWSNEIRAAAPAETGSYPIVTASTNTFAFYSDIDDDGITDYVRYFLSGSTIRKGIIVPTGSPLAYVSTNETFADQVRNVTSSATGIFQYFDSGYAGTASTTPLVQPVTNSDVRLIKITISVDRDPKRLPGPVEVTTQVSFRNMKDNL